MWLSGKESTCNADDARRLGFGPWVRKILWRRKWQPTSVYLPGKSMDRGVWWATVLGWQRVRHNLVANNSSGNLLYKTGSPAWCLVMIWRGGIGEGKEAQKGGVVYIYNHDSFALLFGRNQHTVNQLSSNQKINKEKNKYHILILTHKGGI